jgi:hypothetical protein
VTARLLPFPLQLQLWGHAEWGVFRPLDQCWEDGATWSYGGHRLWDATADDVQAELVVRDPDGAVPVQLWRALPYVALPHGHAHPGGRL